MAEERAERLNLFRPSRSRSAPYPRMKDARKGRTWTVNTMCLSQKDKNKIPTRQEKMVLQKAGLGTKRICFLISDNEKDVQKKLEDEFPKLKNIGGFELLYCQSNCRDLKVVTSKWNVEVLKTVLGSQAKLYVRPIQKCIELTEEENQEEPEIKEKCNNCQGLYSILELRKHVEECEVEVDLQTDETEVEAEAEPSTSGSPIHIDSQGESTENSNQLESPSSINEIIEECIQHIRLNNLTELTAICKYLQQTIVTGRKLELEYEDETHDSDGETNLILVDRYNLLITAFEEIKAIHNDSMRLTLEVQFYGEVIRDAFNLF